MTSYWLHVEGQRYGPYSIDQVREYSRNSPNSVHVSDGGAWVPIHDFLAQIPALSPPKKASRLPWSLVAPVWWAFTWRALLGGTIGSMLGGAGAVVVFLTLGNTPEGGGVATLVGVIGGLLINIFPVSFWAMREALRFRQDGYRS